MATIDLNADVGEGYATDEELLTLVSSANISCGAHAGSEQDIKAAIRSALANGVRIGAHPSYPDREHMGRQSLSISHARLRASLLQQLHDLAETVRSCGGVLQHIKLHGALYNDAARQPELADAVCRWITEFDHSLWVVGLAGGHQQAAAQRHGLRFLAEAFADRAYQADGTLVPRDQHGAMLADAELAVQQALSIVQHRTVISICGHNIPLAADTLCIHGDTSHAIAIARQLRTRLSEARLFTPVRATNGPFKQF